MSAAGPLVPRDFNLKNDRPSLSLTLSLSLADALDASLSRGRTKYCGTFRALGAVWKTSLENLKRENIPASVKIPGAAYLLRGDGERLPFPLCLVLAFHLSPSFRMRTFRNLSPIINIPRAPRLESPDKTREKSSLALNKTKPRQNELSPTARRRAFIQKHDGPRDSD